MLGLEGTLAITCANFLVLIEHFGSHFPRGFASEELNLNQVFCFLTEFSECRSEKYNNEEVV